MARSKAAAELERHIRGQSKGAFTRAHTELDIPHRTFWKYLSGEAVPSVERCVAIWHWSGGRVRVEDWAVPADPDPATVPDPGAGLRAAAAALGVDPDAETGDVVRAIETGPA